VGRQGDRRAPLAAVARPRSTRGRSK
jgi:hypothetical protein